MINHSPDNLLLTPFCDGVGVFVNITGNTISLTVSTAMSTIDGGNPDGDIVYLTENSNTVTINYI
jgi:hypothetical protein